MIRNIYDGRDRVSNRRLPALFIGLGPGLLVAATGVGAGDLATAAFTGSHLGPAVLWAVVVGAAMKFLLTEGLARWQLATGHTLLEGAVLHFGRAVQALFLVYLVFWSFFVGSALISACGVTAHALWPIFEPETGKIVFGLLHSAAALILVQLGGYRLFEKVMRVCILVMFVTVIATAVAVGPDWSTTLSGLLIPRIPDASGQGFDWTIALIGGVGGTLTILCYGYWIREEGWQNLDRLRDCRVDLACGYVATAIFGVCMVIIGSRIEVAGRGSELIVLLSQQLETELGPIGRWAFLIGAWGAVSSSLLGVWQAVPYLFTDYWNLTRAATRSPDVSARNAVDSGSWPYRIYLYALAIIPAAGLWGSFEQVQKIYAIVGAAFVPLLALVLLILNGRARWVGTAAKNSPLTSVLLILTMAFFVAAGWFKFF